MEFPPAGLNFIKSCLQAYINPGPNSHFVYRRPYTAQSHHTYLDGDIYDQQYTATAFWLVGVNVNTYNGYITW